MRSARGFTLVELMVVIAILVIMAAVAIPSYTSFIANQRVKTASFNLYASIIYARSEAIKRSCLVTITPTDATNWAQGWTVATGSSCPSVTTLRTQGNMGTFSIVTAATALTYRPDGRISGAQTTFTLTSPSGNQGRCIRIDASGSPAIKMLQGGGTC